MSERYLIVGLGNPGKEYEKNRHNVGFHCLDAIAAAYNMSFGKLQNRAITADGTIADKRVTLAKPSTFMNLSGESVRGLRDFYKLTNADLIVIHDDLDIPLGTLRIREKGSAGGQNGVKNIIAQLGTQEFARIRFGIDRPPGRMDAASYVLQDFTKEQLPIVMEVKEQVIKAVETWLKDGLPIAMNKFNGEVK